MMLLSVSELKAVALKSALMLMVLMGVSRWSGVTAMAAPFSATCVLLVLLPHLPFSTPRTVLLSHLLCLGAGLLLLYLPLAPLAQMIGATWIGLMLMAWLRAVHAPALAHAVILCLGQQQVASYLGWALLVAASFALFALLSARQHPAAQAGA